MKEVTITLETNQGNITFSVRHNLHKFGLDIYAAVTNWMYRTNNHTVRDFCKYVKSKDPINIKCEPVW